MFGQAPSIALRSYSAFGGVKPMVSGWSRPRQFAEAMRSCARVACLLALLLLLTGLSGYNIDDIAVSLAFRGASAQYQGALQTGRWPRSVRSPEAGDD